MVQVHYSVAFNNHGVVQKQRGFAVIADARAEHNRYDGADLVRDVACARLWGATQHIVGLWTGPPGWLQSP